MELTSISDFLKMRRKQLRLTQAQVAVLAHTSQQHISMLERGALEPSISTLQSVLSALGWSLSVEPVSNDKPRLTARLEGLGRMNEWENLPSPSLSWTQALRLAGGMASLAMSGANPFEEALRELAAFLDGERIPYMIIGAVAGLAWGLRRATFDVDLTVWAPEREAALVGILARRFEPRPPEPESFAAATGVLPVRVLGVDVDIVFGRLPYEEAAIRRSRRIPLGGIALNVCAPEDLIVHKIISERPKDREDVEALFRCAGRGLDFAYLDPIVEGLARDLERPDILARYRGLKAR